MFLKQCGPARPQVLIMDGHHSHEVTEMLKLAKMEGIEIIALPPHSSHWLQPLDKGVFGPLKKAFNIACSDFMSQSPGNVVVKATFAKLFSTAWEKAVTSDNIRQGFKFTGIWPYDMHVIPPHAFAPATVYTDESVNPEPLQEVPQRNTYVPSPDVQNMPLSSKPNNKNVSVAPEPFQEVPHSPTPLPFHSVQTVPISIPGEPNLESFHSQDGHIFGDDLMVSEVVDVQTTNAQTPDSLFELLVQVGGIEEATSNNVSFDEVTSASVPVPSVSSVIEEVVGLPKVLKKESMPTKNRKRSNPGHRILTSDEIIAQKVQFETEKASKLKQKEERKRKKEETKSVPTKKGKQLYQPPKHRVVPDVCVMCMSWKTIGFDLSITCVRCKRWMHQICVPLAYRAIMESALESEEDFICHLCSY